MVRIVPYKSYVRIIRTFYWVHKRYVGISHFRPFFRPIDETVERYKNYDLCN
jgi:hypothetical protein